VYLLDGISFVPVAGRPVRDHRAIKDLEAAPRRPALKDRCGCSDTFRYPFADPNTWSRLSA
jgi:hypothetical protein